MNSKQTALLKDLAKLLAKYSARDLQALVKTLSANRQGLSKATSSKAKTGKKPARKSLVKKEASPAKAKTRKTSKKKAASKLQVRKKTNVATRAPEVSQVDALPKRILSRISTGQLRDFYLRAFNEKRLPKNRALMVSELEGYLQKMPSESRAAVLISLSRGSEDSTDTYTRWAHIISYRRRGEPQ